MGVTAWQESKHPDPRHPPAAPDEQTPAALSPSATAPLPLNGLQWKQPTAFSQPGHAQDVHAPGADLHHEKRLWREFRERAD
jgi:hypothetical protein